MADASNDGRMGDVEVTMQDSQQNPDMVAEQRFNNPAAAENPITSLMLTNAMTNIKSLIDSETDEKIKEFAKAFSKNIDEKIKVKESAFNAAIGKKLEELEANINISL